MYVDRLLRRPPRGPAPGFGSAMLPRFFVISLHDEQMPDDVDFTSTKLPGRRGKRMHARYRQALMNVRMRMKGHCYAGR